MELQQIQIEPGQSGEENSSDQNGPVVSAQTQDGQLILEVSIQDTEPCNGLGVIITRMDAHAGPEGSGNYVLQVSVKE